MKKGDKGEFLTQVYIAASNDKSPSSIKLELPPPDEPDEQPQKTDVALMEGKKDVPPPAVPPVPAAIQKPKQGNKKNVTLDSSISVGSLTITPDMVNSIAEKMFEINAAGCNVRIHPAQDLELNMLAKKLRYEHKLKSVLNKL